MANQGSNEDLTTDACPSPPRENFETKSNPKENVTNDYDYRKPKKTKSKVKRGTTHAVANVININNANGIHIGSNYTINMNKSQTEPTTEANITKTKAICNLLKRTDPVTKEIISYVSEHIGKNWKAVCRLLGYSDGQLFQYQQNNSLYELREVVYKLLLDWIQNKPDDAKVGILFDALWNGFERDVVQRVAEDENFM